MIKEKIKNKINNSKKYVFFKSDFKKYNSSTVYKVLNELINEEKIKRVSKGIYVKTRINNITGKIMFSHPNGKNGLYIEILNKLNVKYEFDEFSKDYMEGKSTQIPANIKIVILDKNFKRKIDLK